MSEHEEQTAFITWFRMQYQGVLIYAIPNGGKRSMSEAKRIKDEGGVAGIPDLHVPQWKLWIEMKRADGGRVSNEQKSIKAHLEMIGHTVIIGKGCMDAINQVREYVHKSSN